MKVNKNKTKQMSKKLKKNVKQKQKEGTSSNQQKSWMFWNVTNVCVCIFWHFHSFLFAVSIKQDIFLFIVYYLNCYNPCENTSFRQNVQREKNVKTKNIKYGERSRLIQKMMP